MQHIRMQRDGAVGTITIDRPARFNAMDVVTAQDFRRAGLQFARDHEVRAVVLRGLPGMFCSGADLKFIRDGGAFTNGYAATASIDIVFGTITGSAGAGQIYYTVPVILKGIATNSQHGNYAACYVVHLSRPENFSNPPIQPMSIDRGKAKGISLTTSDANALAGACTGSDFPVSSPVIIAAPTLHIDAGNYLDNRSGPIETVSSYLNTLNSKQYVRAYSYWQNAASAVGPYTQYANGFADTAAVGVTFGTFSSDAGAGQLYYKVPLAMTVQTTTNAIQVFVGCFTLHLAQPAAQGTYPFQPMGISSGKFVQQNNNADINSLLTTACQ